jgi:hypothetical protein
VQPANDYDFHRIIAFPTHGYLTSRWFIAPSQIEDSIIFNGFSNRFIVVVTVMTKIRPRIAGVAARVPVYRPPTANKAVSLRSIDKFRYKRFCLA